MTTQEETRKAQALEALETWFKSPLSQGFIYDGMKETIREVLQPAPKHNSKGVRI